MVSTIMQAAVTSNVPQLMILQMLQLISDWQNPSDLTWYRSLEEITTQCPIQKIEFLKLAKECDKIPTDKSISEEISKTLEKIHVKFGTSSAINQVRDVSSNQYINVNLGEALEEKTYMIQELRMKIKDIEMKQLTEIESRLEYETQFIQQIQEQQNQLENLRSLVESSTETEIDKSSVLFNINKQQNSINTLKTDAECARRTSLLSESMMNNFMSVGDRLIAIEKSQVQQQRTLQSFRFKQQDQDNLVTENEKLKDEVERLHGELKNSTVESSYLREELENKVEIINFLNTTLQNINKGREDDENSEDYKTKTQENILPLLEAVKLGDLEAMGNILDEGIDPNERDNDGWTPLHRAVESGNTMIVKMLVEHGADLFAHIHSHSGDLPIHTAAVNNKIQIINYFINNGVPVDARNYLGTTPLLAAVWDNQIATIRFLVEYCKAEINAQVYNLDNRTGLHLTALYGYDEIAKYLLVKKAYMELRTSGNCSAHEHDQDSDYNNEHCDNMSATPLHWAARYGHWNVGKMLVDNGADMYTKDGLGRTPQEVAQFYGHLMFVKLLEEESERLEEEYMI